MPIWNILVSDNKTETVEADVIHHDATGSLYFSIQLEENEYIICRGFAARQWKDLLLVSLQSHKPKQTKSKHTKEHNDYN